MNTVEPQKFDEISIDPGRRKRLGQFFTGVKLARLLAAISDARGAQAILDPMGGSGDMLAACLEVDGQAKTCVSVEVDPVAVAVARQRQWNTSVRPLLLQANAFDPATIEQLPQKLFDLVITNPPYVRYQSLSKEYNGDIKLPNAVEIRSSLLELVGELPDLDADDRILFRTLIGSYSGLSDLAVPSWFLCALLTRVGGKLAMVIPESWLTRDYAQVVQYLLLRWFRIQHVVEDTHAVWFPDALVKTTLLVAERTARRASAFDWQDERYLHVRVNGQAMSASSAVGNIYPEASRPEQAFAEYLAGLRAAERSAAEPLFTAEWTTLRQQSENLKRSAVSQKWLRDVEDSMFAESVSGADLGGSFIHSSLSAWLGVNETRHFSTLEAAGVKVGQGLRTGANRFFYVARIARLNDEIEVAPDPIFGIKSVRIPSTMAPQVLRKQSELGSGYIVDTSILKGHVLDLRGYALPEDLDYGRPAGVKPIYAAMRDDLAALVRVAQTTNLGSDAEPKWIPELSAVRTNAKAVDEASFQGHPRFWYMLPPFAPRHKPDLFVARVNSGHPKAVLNAVEPILIDANFSTFCLSGRRLFDRPGLLAYLNSSWCVAWMELTGSVMGGGALKLEASHLRRLPVPAFNTSQLRALSKLGERLTSAAEDSKFIRDDIDKLVIAALLPSDRVEEKLLQLRTISRSQLEARIRTKK